MGGGVAFGGSTTGSSAASQRGGRGEGRGGIQQCRGGRQRSAEREREMTTAVTAAIPLTPDLLVGEGE